MKKQLSSLELHFLLKELDVLKGSRTDKIYQPEKNIIIISFYKSNAGKKLLRIDVGQSLFITDERETEGETLGFGMLLRKHLDGYFLYDIGQIEPERIIKLSFMAKDDKKCLYLEFFGKGNAILCNGHDVIINALEHHEFRERAVKPKLKYVYPVMGCNVFKITGSQMEELFKNSKKESVVACLAVELGLGGVYSEEICLLSGIDKNINPRDVSNREIESLLDSIRKMLGRKIEPQVIVQDSNPLDFVPFEFEFYKSHQKKPFSTFSEAISFFYSHFKEVKETEFDRKMGSLQRIIEGQKQAIERLKEEEKELREKGELIYHKYALVKEILDEITKASKKYSWKEIKEKLKGHKVVKDLNEKERRIVVEV